MIMMPLPKPVQPSQRLASLFTITTGPANTNPHQLCFPVISLLLETGPTNLLAAHFPDPAAFEPATNYPSNPSQFLLHLIAGQDLGVPFPLIPRICRTHICQDIYH